MGLKRRPLTDMAAVTIASVSYVLFIIVACLVAGLWETQ